jgi:hypothetical protein
LRAGARHIAFIWLKLPFTLGAARVNRKDLRQRNYETSKHDNARLKLQSWFSRTSTAFAIGRLGTKVIMLHAEQKTAALQLVGKLSGGKKITEEHALHMRHVARPFEQSNQESSPEGQGDAKK